MTENRESFREGATAFRNLRDYVETHRNSFIEEANYTTRYVRAPSLSTTLTESRESISVLYEDRSNTSIDKLAAEELTTKRHRYRSTTTRSTGISTSNVVLESSSRYTRGGAGKSVYRIALNSSTPPSTPSRHTIAGDTEETKRRIRPF
jgi:hypothetical protein